LCKKKIEIGKKGEEEKKEERNWGEERERNLNNIFIKRFLLPITLRCRVCRGWKLVYLTQQHVHIGTYRNRSKYSKSENVRFTFS
jgi:hypothetical protein